MFKFSVILFFLTLSMALFAQNKAIDLVWSKTFNDFKKNGSSYFKDAACTGAVQLGEDYILLSTYTEASIVNQSDTILKAEGELRRVSNTGKVLWHRFIKFDTSDLNINKIMLCQDGNIIISGNKLDKSSSNILAAKMIVFKINSENGATIWMYEVKEIIGYTIEWIHEQQDGTVYFFFQQLHIFSLNKHKNTFIGFFYLSKTGNIIGVKQISTGSMSRMLSLCSDNNKVFVLMETIFSFHKNTDIVEDGCFSIYECDLANFKVKEIKIDSDVNDNNTVYNLMKIVKSDNRLMILGGFLEKNYLGESINRPIVLFFDSFYNMYVEKSNTSYSGKKIKNFKDGLIDSDGNIFVAGTTIYTPQFDLNLTDIESQKKIDSLLLHSTTNIWVAKYDKKMHQVWEYEIGGSANDAAINIFFGPRNTLLIAGYSTDEYTDETAISLIELRERGTKVVDSIPPKVWALVVGVSKYSNLQQKKGFGNLQYAASDAQRFGEFLRSAAGGALPDHQFRILVDSQATRKAILQNARELFAQAAPRDLIIIYFAGHGKPNQLMGYDYALSHEEVKNLLAESRARKRLCVADACYSGSFSPELMHFSPENDAEQTRRYYEELGHSGDGMAMLLSSSKSETSLEANDLQQGIFSYYCMEGLRGAADSNADKLVTIQELYDFVAEKVSRKAAELGKSQRPQLKGIFDRDMPVGVTK